MKAGQDKVVRMNNDTYYKMAFLMLDQGSVTLRSTNPSKDRFSSYQLMDDRNVNFRNLIHPSGTYTLYYGARPEGLEGEAVEVPSEAGGRDRACRGQVDGRPRGYPEAAKTVFAGLTIEGPTIAGFPELDLLSGFEPRGRGGGSSSASTSASRRRRSPKLVPEAGDLPNKVSYLQLAAGTKGGWGGPVTTHSAYDTIFAGCGW